MESGPQHSDQAVIVALGSNLKGAWPSTEALLEAALAAMAEAGLRPILRSRWWRSTAWPDPTDPAYLNGVAIIETPCDLQETLLTLHALEAKFGRARHLTNAPRTLDLDLVAYGRQIVDQPGVRVPHPRAAERKFVMGPLAEIAPGWTHPVNGRTAAQLAVLASVGVDAAPVTDAASTPRS